MSIEISLQDSCGSCCHAMPHVHLQFIAGHLYMKKCLQEPQSLGLEALYNVGMPANLPVPPKDVLSR